MFPIIFPLALALFTGFSVGKRCINFTVPVEIMARNGIFSIPSLASNQDATTFAQNYASIMGGSNYTMEALTGYQTVTGSYNLSAKFCRPDVLNGSNPTVQVLSHGIGFDKSYWDLPYNNFSYSYIDVATDEHGFCTLTYDRFGIGNSSHADPLHVIQAPAEVSALYQINKMLREGRLPGVNHAFTMIVNIGHSYGSQLSYQLATMYPNSTDALVLTGFSFNDSFLPSTIGSFNSKLARLNQPLRFGSISAAAVQEALSSLGTRGFDIRSVASGLNLTFEEVTQIFTTTEVYDLVSGYDARPAPISQDLPPGYLTWVDSGANQFNFLAPPYFDPMILSFAEANKQPYTVGEILTLGGAPVTSTFAGPVEIITGREDAIYCGGDCLNTAGMIPAVSSIPAAAQKYFPRAKSFEVHIQPESGNALNLHYVARQVYELIQQFLDANGLAPS